MDKLIHLIYSSTAICDFPEAELLGLLEKARARNGRLNVTGMLLYTDRSFFQVLEGERTAIEVLFADILQDPRHSQIVTIIREPIRKRAFSEWTMGYANITAADIREIVGLNDFFAEGRCFGQLDPGRAKKLLTAFRDGRWRAKIGPVIAHDEVVMKPASMDGSQVAFAFQPIVNADTTSIESYEALFRSADNQPLDRVLQCVPLAARASFDAFCRAKAIVTAARLGLAHDLILKVGAFDLQDAKTAMRSTLDAIEWHHLDPGRIVLEIDQDHLAAAPEKVANIIDQYRSAGFKIGISHFGSGWASLSMLEPYRPELIALNGHLVRGIAGHGPKQSIVRGIVQICRDLGVDVVAKCVETADEFSWLRMEGIHLFQGALFAEPALECLPAPYFPT